MPTEERRSSKRIAEPYKSGLRCDTGRTHPVQETDKDQKTKENRTSRMGGMNKQSGQTRRTPEPFLPPKPQGIVKRTGDRAPARSGCPVEQELRIHRRPQSSGITSKAQAPILEKAHPYVPALALQKPRRKRMRIYNVGPKTQ
jgi:hypothetical protein